MIAATDKCDLIGSISMVASPLIRIISSAPNPPRRLYLDLKACQCLQPQAMKLPGETVGGNINMIMAKRRRDGIMFISLCNEQSGGPCSHRQRWVCRIYYLCSEHRLWVLTPQWNGSNEHQKYVWTLVWTKSKKCHKSSSKNAIYRNTRALHCTVMFTLWDEIKSVQPRKIIYIRI